jgi:hypothetical protein
MLRRFDQTEGLQNCATETSVLAKSEKYRTKFVSIILDIIFSLRKDGTYLHQFVSACTEYKVGSFQTQLTEFYQRLDEEIVDVSE